MATVAQILDSPTPVEIVEQIITAHNWPFERPTEDQIIIDVMGRCGEYHIEFLWYAEEQVLHMACGFKFIAPFARREEFYMLVELLNEQLLVGHFNYWPTDNMVLFRHAALCPGEDSFSPEQAEAMFLKALEVCEDNYSAFNLVANGQTAQRALEMNIREVYGTA